MWIMDDLSYYFVKGLLYNVYKVYVLCPYTVVCYVQNKNGNDVNENDDDDDDDDETV